MVGKEEGEGGRSRVESEEGWRREEVRGGGMGGKREESREVHIRPCTLSVHITM